MTDADVDVDAEASPDAGGSSSAAPLGDRGESVVPALGALAESQREVHEDLMTGFSERRHVVVWCHRAQIVTLGRLSDGFGQRVFADRWRLGALLGDEEARERLSDRSPDDNLAAFERDLLADNSLLLGCRDAIREIADQANDYAAVDGLDQPDERIQQYLAMRPALDELVERQRTVLEWPLGLEGAPPSGLRSRRDISRWSRALVRASRGIEDGLAHASNWDLWTRRVLLAEPSSASLHFLLASEVLPVFRSAIRRQVTAAREVASEDTPNHGPIDT